MIKYNFFFLILFSAFTPNYGQVWEGGLACYNNNEMRVKNWYKNGFIDSFGLLQGDGGWFGPQISSSFLKAEGSPPAINENDPTIGSYNYDMWSCMYSAHQIIDNNLKTSWCEGKKDDGIGEIILFAAPLNQKIFIRNGVAFSKVKYHENNRIAKIEIKLFSGSNCHEVTKGNDAGGGIVCNNIKQISSGFSLLNDSFDWQELILPDFNKTEMNYFWDLPTTYIAIKIISVYKGNKFRDTCISEIKFKGSDTFFYTK